MKELSDKKYMLITYEEYKKMEELIKQFTELIMKIQFAKNIDIHNEIVHFNQNTYRMWI